MYLFKNKKKKQYPGDACNGWLPFDNWICQRALHEGEPAIIITHSVPTESNNQLPH